MTTTVKMVLIIMNPKTLKKSAKRILVVMVLIIIFIMPMTLTKITKLLLWVMVLLW